eukprot:Rhum_TRINITY_DN14799_c1_g1::Rhum_TRINITY_DN14799_c1_g1_i1::g.117003::m.117003
MHIVLSRSGVEDAVVEVDAECSTLAALQHAVSKDVPELSDVALYRLEWNGDALCDAHVPSLSDGDRVAAVPTDGAVAATLLRERGRVADSRGFEAALEDGSLEDCKLFWRAGVECDGGAVDASVRYRMSDFLEWLLTTQGCDVNARCRSGNETVLFTAAEYDNVVAARVLLKHGADVRLVGDGADTATTRAWECHSHTTADFLERAENGENPDV